MWTTPFIWTFVSARIICVQRRFRWALQIHSLLSWPIYLWGRSESQLGIHVRRYVNWGPPRGYGEEGNNVIYFRDKGDHKSKNEGTGEQREFWGAGNIKIWLFILGNKGKCLNISGEQGNRYPRVGLFSDIVVHLFIVVAKRTLHFRSISGQSTQEQTCLIMFDI